MIECRAPAACCQLLGRARLVGMDDGVDERWSDVWGGEMRVDIATAGPQQLP